MQRFFSTPASGVPGSSATRGSLAYHDARHVPAMVAHSFVVIYELISDHIAAVLRGHVGSVIGRAQFPTAFSGSAMADTGMQPDDV